MPDSTPTTSIFQVLEVLFRHKWKVLLIPTAIIAAGISIALFAPRSYRSEAKLALQVGRESVNMSPTASTGQPTISLQQMGREGEVTTAMDLIKSRGVIAKVVDKVGVEHVLNGTAPGEGAGEDKPVSPLVAMLDSTVGAAAGWAIGALKSIDPISDREDAIITIEESLVVDAERDSTLIVVTYSTDTPEGAQHILTNLIDVYKTEHLRIHRNEGSKAFFEKQEAQLRKELNAAMDRVRVAKDRIGVASIATRREHLESQLQSVTMAAYDAESARQAGLAEIADLRRQLGPMPERMIASKKSVPNQGADLLRDQLYALQVRQADLKARYSDSHPLVLAISSQVNEAERVVEGQKNVREETTDDINPIHRELSLSLKQSEISVASLEARLDALRNQDQAIRRDLEKLNADAVEITQLEREEEILNRNYFRYADNLEQARIDEELQNQQISSVSLAQEPTCAAKPVSPSKLLVALGSMVLALAGTAATILGLEQVSDKLRGENAIEKAVGVPVLASIPESAIHGRVLAP